MLVLALVISGAFTAVSLTGAQFSGKPAELIVALITSFISFALFALTQALLADGVARALAGGRLDLGTSVRAALARGTDLVASVLLVAGILMLWSLVCGVGVLIGIRQSYVALPACVLEKRGAMPSLSRSRGLVVDSSNRIFGLTVLFAVALLVCATAAGFVIGLVFVDNAGGIVRGAGKYVLDIAIGAIQGTLGVVWATITCVVYQRLTGGVEESDVARVAEVF